MRFFSEIRKMKESDDGQKKTLKFFMLDKPNPASVRLRYLSDELILFVIMFFTHPVFFIIIYYDL